MLTLPGTVNILNSTWHRNAQRIPRQAELRRVPGAQGRRSEAPEEARAAVLLRPEAPGQPPALRPAPRARRRLVVVGGAQGTVHQSGGQTPGDARRGSPHRVRHLRRRHPRRLRRRHRDALGRGHLGTSGRRRGRGAEEGRPQAAAPGREAEGLVGPDPHKGRRRAQLAADQAPRRVGRPRRHRDLRAVEHQERRRLHRHPRTGVAGPVDQQPRRQGRFGAHAEGRGESGGDRGGEQGTASARPATDHEARSATKAGRTKPRRPSSPKPKAATTASAPARSTPRTPAASGRAARSRATRSRPR